MIIKIIPNPNNTRTIAKVVRYCIGAKGREDPSSWQRGEDGLLACVDIVDGERVGTVRVTNCMSDDPADATLEMMAVQKLNTRSDTEKHYHMVISFPPGEMVSDEVLAQIEHDVCASLGMEAHQRISAVHHDKEHLHLHILLNKVHPETFNNINPHYPIKSLMKAADEIELKYGLILTNHTSQSQTSGRAGDMEAHSAEQSLLRWIKEEVLLDISAQLSQASSWQEMHELLAGYGLEYRPKGAGAVIAVIENPVLVVKASSVERSLSFTQIKQRLGDYTQPTENVATEVKMRYVQKPIRSAEMSSALYRDYQQYRKDRGTAQQQALQQERLVQADFYSKHKAWYVQEKQRIQHNRTYRGVQKRTALLRLKARYLEGISNARHHAAERKKEIYAHNGLMNWQSYLQHQADAGNMEAITLLKQREKRQIQLQANIVHAPDLAVVSQIASRGIRSFTDKFGDTCYALNDGGFVKRHGDGFQVIRDSEAVIGFVLHAALAGKKDNRLRINGEDSFVRKAIAMLVDKDEPVLLNNKTQQHYYDQLKSERIERLGLLADIITSMDDRIPSLVPSCTVVHIKQWTNEQKGDFILHEVREVKEGMKVALLQQKETLYVKALSLPEQNTLGSLKRGDRIKSLAYGRLVAKGRKR